MREPFERLMVGRTLGGRYALEACIGTGGMSVVFRGRDERLDRAVAVKVVSLAGGGDEAPARMRERFRREAAAAARIARHPNVVQVFDYGTDPELDLDFIVMELLRGRDLKEALRGGPLPPHDAVRILCDAARGIGAGHAEGMVHRDVKPANVFLVRSEGGREDVRVLDFGIAKPMGADPDDSLTTVGELPHSPAYASPEQVKPGAALTPASDVYQLGLLGYEMLSGSRPYGEAERLRVREGEAVPLPGTDAWAAVPAAVRDVIERALDPDPEARPGDADALADALTEAAEATHRAGDETVLAHPGDDDRTRMMAPLPATPAAEPPAAHTAPDPDTNAQATSPAHRRSPALWLVPAALLAVVALWAATRGGSDAESVDATTTSESAAPDTRSMDDAFLRLQAEVAERAAEASQDADDADAADDEGDATASVSPRDAARIAQEVQLTVAELSQAFAAGDVEGHLGYYADTVEFAGRARSKETLRRDVTRLIRRYPSRQLTLLRQASTVMDEPDRARTLVDREWRYEGSRERWEGADRKDMLLERRGERWIVVRDEQVEVYRSTRSRI
jgi:serine/threonine protein kinase